jgi:hypothetical protein
MLIRVVLVLSVGGCARHAPSAHAAPAAHAAPTSPAAPHAVASGCLPTHDGYLRVRMRGAHNLDIDWRDAELQCDGGPRPNQRGIRLAFAGPVLPDGHRLRFVFGIAGAESADTSHALPANVTVIFEGENKLYSTRGEDKCTIEQLTRAPMAAQTLRVAGRGFCVGPAAAVDGGEGLLLSRFDFAGTMVDAE